MSSRSKKASRAKAGKPGAKTIAKPARFKLSRGQIYAIFTVILLIAAGLRFYEIKTVPPGLYLDEAADGTNAVQAWETGDFKVFYPEDNGREGLYINVASVFIHFLGSTAWALRLPATIFGLLTVWGIYALTVELVSPVAGLAAAFFLATSYWHLNFSRIAFRAIGAPFFLVWALYILLLAFRRLRAGRGFAVLAAVAGVVYALGFYTYIAYRVTPILVVLVLSLLFVEALQSGWLRRYWTAVSLFATCAAATLYPLAAYIMSHPGTSTGRMSQVSVFQSANPVLDIAGNIWKTVGMLYWKGDANWRHNFASKPEVFWPVALLMTLGIAVAIRKMFTRSSVAVLLPPSLLVLWIACGAVPAVLSNEGQPHALRSILMLPPIVIFAAMGAVEISSFVSTKIPMPMLSASVIVLACALVYETANTYFFRWAVDPQTPEWFDGEGALMAAQLNSLPAKQPKVVAIDGPSEVDDPFFPSLMALRFLARGVTSKQQDESNIHFYTPRTFPSRLPAGDPGAGDFCTQVKTTMPQAAVTCIVLRKRTNPAVPAS